MLKNKLKDIINDMDTNLNNLDTKINTNTKNLNTNLSDKLSTNNLKTINNQNLVGTGNIKISVPTFTVSGSTLTITT
jgi:hypothetical protein